MSTELIADGETGLYLTQYVGPDYGGDRRRYEITTDSGMTITLSQAEWESLGEWFTRDCSPDCPSRTTTQPRGGST
jgi:hypothetical protein